MFAQNLPPDTSISFTNDDLVTNTTIDPALGTDESIGVYDLGSGPTDSVTVSNDVLSGFFQPTFMEGFPGTLVATDSTYEDLTPITPGPFAPEGVYLLADAGGPMTGSYTISGNTFEGYSGYGVRAKSGFFNPNQTGVLQNVSVRGNLVDVGTLASSQNGSAAIGIVGANNGGNTISGVTVASNSVTASGAGAVDVQVSGNVAGNNFSGIRVTGNDLLGGPTVTGIDNEVPTAVDGAANFWGEPGGPGAPGATVVASGNGGTVTTAPSAVQSVFSPAAVTASPTAAGPVTSALVAWSAPSSAADVPVTAYSVTATDLNTGVTGAAILAAASTTSIVVPGLVAGDRYQFAVTAENTLIITAPGISNVVGGPDGRGYWLDATDGGIFTFGSAQFYGSTGNLVLNQPMVGMAATPDGKGYWLVAADGGVFAFGDAGYFGSMGGKHLNEPVVGMASTPSGRGYWLVARDGGLFAFGDAGYFGSTGGMALNAPILAMTSTPDGKGYWLVAADGGLFNFGDAGYYGSGATLTLGGPVVGIATSPTGHGYWMATTNGGVFAFGDATFFGSMATQPLTQPIVGIAANPTGSGYWLDARDGGVFAFGGTQFWGSMGGTPLNAPVVGMAAH